MGREDSVKLLNAHAEYVAHTGAIIIEKTYKGMDAEFLPAWRMCFFELVKKQVESSQKAAAG